MFALPFVAYWAAARRDPLSSALFVVASIVVLVLHAPVFLFDGPLPLNDLRVYGHGRIHIVEQGSSGRAAGRVRSFV
jgi:hypothetical protein